MYFKSLFYFIILENYTYIQYTHNLSIIYIESLIAFESFTLIPPHPGK